MRMHQPLQPLQRGFEHHPLQTGFDKPPPKQDSITDSQPPNGIRPTSTQTGFHHRLPTSKRDSTNLHSKRDSTNTLPKHDSITHSKRGYDQHPPQTGFHHRLQNPNGIRLSHSKRRFNHHIRSLTHYITKTD